MDAQLVESLLFGCRFKSLSRFEERWTFEFDQSAQLTVESPWRLLNSQSVIIASSGDNRPPAEVGSSIVAAETTAFLINSSVVGAKLDRNTLDLELAMSCGSVLQLFSDSTDFEAWQLVKSKILIVAGVGGVLSVFR